MVALEEVGTFLWVCCFVALVEEGYSTDYWDGMVVEELRAWSLKHFHPP